MSIVTLAVGFVVPNIRAQAIYVTLGSNSIAKFDPAGSGSVLASGGNIFNPLGMAVDTAGNIYVADSSGGNKIARYSSTGVDLGIFAQTNLNDPDGLAFDIFGNLLVANISSSNIVQFDHTGTYIGVFANTLGGPHSLVFDSTWTLFISETGDTIERFPYLGNRSYAVWTVPGANYLAVDGEGNLYATTGNNNTVVKITPDGVSSVFASTGLSNPQGLAFNPTTGALLVVNNGTQDIVQFSSTGEYIGVFASFGADTPREIVAIPEPLTTPLLVGVAAGCLAFYRRRRMPGGFGSAS